MMDSNGLINAGSLVNHHSSPPLALLLAVHPDNKLLSRGDAISRHAVSGHRLDVCLVEEGATSLLPQRDRTPSAEEGSDLREAAQSSDWILGVTMPIKDAKTMHRAGAIQASFSGQQRSHGNAITCILGQAF